MAGLGGSGAYFAGAVAVGGVVGFIGALFHISVDTLVMWPGYLRDDVGLSGPALYLAGALLAASMTLASLWLVRRFAPEASGSGVPEIEGAMEGTREVHWRRVLPVKFFGGILALSSGLVLGREGPTIHIGASIAKATSEFAGWRNEDMRALLAAGGAAGLAAAFNAPLAAVLFVIEETRRQFPYSPRSYIAVMLASVTSAIVTANLTGRTPFMFLPDVPAVPVASYPIFILLGAVLGVAGVVFNRTLVWSLDRAADLGQRVGFYLFPALTGLTVGILMFVLPDATQGGEILAVHLTEQGLPLGLLALLVLIRFIMTMASYSTGVTGGIFAPILALATAIGLTFAVALGAILPTDVLGPGFISAMAIAAMAGLFASTIGAQLVGVVLVLELTGAYDVLVPAMLAAIFSNMVSHWLGGRPIYEVLLERTLAIEARKKAAAPVK